MNEFYIYICGFILMAVFYYLVNTTQWAIRLLSNIFGTHEDHPKMYWVYASLKAGLTSWVGIFFVIVASLGIGTCLLDEIIKNKLDKYENHRK